MAPSEAMARALALAELAHGRTSPNPVVGSVIVADGKVVGEGYHHGPGQPHAEREALAAAGDKARGATLYCTLEPCCHHGRTPPCTDGIIAAGVTRVVFGVLDADPKVAGRGAAQLRAAGIDVEHGLLAPEIGRQLGAYLHHRRTGRPLVTAKWAMTLDGKLATATGDSRWVSGPTARHMVHELRDHVDAVLVGSGTVLADDPSLTVRLDHPSRPTRNPLRVVVDTHGRVPATARLFGDGEAPTLLVVGASCPVTERGQAEVLRLPERDGHVDPTALLTALGERGIVELLCEAGGGLTGALLRAGLIDRVMAIIAPKLVGGDGPTPWDGAGREPMSAALRLIEVEMTPAGDDYVLRGRLERA